MWKFNLLVLLSLVPRVDGRELWVRGWRPAPAGLTSTNSLSKSMETSQRVGHYLKCLCGQQKQITGAIIKGVPKNLKAKSIFLLLQSLNKAHPDTPEGGIIINDYPSRALAPMQYADIQSAYVPNQLGDIRAVIYCQKYVLLHVMKQNTLSQSLSTSI